MADSSYLVLVAGDKVDDDMAGDRVRGSVASVASTRLCWVVDEMFSKQYCTPDGHPIPLMKQPNQIDQDSWFYSLNEVSNANGQ